MKVTLLSRLSLYTDYQKKWLYCLTSGMSYHIDGVTLPDGKIYQYTRLLGDVKNNVLTIHKGYAFDGMTSFMDEAENLSCALLHDFLYQTAIVSRKDADRLLRACMTATGANHRSLVWLGVSLFGWMHYGKEKGIRMKL